MFYLIKNWKISDSSENYISAFWFDTLEYEFNDEEKRKIENWYLIQINNEKEITFISTEESIEKEISDIKKQASIDIESKYPLYSQINMLAEINEIHLLARQEDRTFTEEEMKKVWEWAVMKNWIDQKRKEANDKILEITQINNVKP
mgnify:CR=1 FL=1